MTVRIERAHVRDVTRVKPLWKLLVARYQEVAGDDWPVRDPQEAWDRRHQEYMSWINEGAGVLLLALEEECVGYAALRFVDPGSAMKLGENVGVIETLVVDPEHRGRGIGTQLMVACRRELERRGIAYCSMETLTANEDAIALATTTGFRPYMTRMIRRIDLD
ncbi:MAG: GNAT family N-acetyltransferase [Mobilicoccus sp.]|nr:GNAT family N-acetyltransferase [Mobilicoccus sp.]